MNIWDDLLHTTEDLLVKTQIGRVRWACQMAFIMVNLKDYNAAEEWLDRADQIARDAKVAWEMEDGVA